MPVSASERRESTEALVESHFPVCIKLSFFVYSPLYMMTDIWYIYQHSVAMDHLKHLIPLPISHLGHGSSSQWRR